MLKLCHLIPHVAQGNQNARELPQNTRHACDNDTESPGMHISHQSTQLQLLSYFELLWRLVVVVTLSWNQITINLTPFQTRIQDKIHP